MILPSVFILGDSQGLHSFTKRAVSNSGKARACQFFFPHHNCISPQRQQTALKPHDYKPHDYFARPIQF